MRERGLGGGDGGGRWWLGEDRPSLRDFRRYGGGVVPIPGMNAFATNESSLRDYRDVKRVECPSGPGLKPFARHESSLRDYRTLTLPRSDGARGGADAFLLRWLATTGR
jgi:hypothetical protein